MYCLPRESIPVQPPSCDNLYAHALRIASRSRPEPHSIPKVMPEISCQDMLTNPSSWNTTDTRVPIMPRDATKANLPSVGP